MTIHKHVIRSRQMPSDGDLLGEGERRIIAVVRRTEVEMVEVCVSLSAFCQPKRADGRGHSRGFGIITLAGTCGWREQVIVKGVTEFSRLVFVARANPKIRAAAIRLQ